MENKIINIISSVTSIPEDELKKNTDDENLWDSIQKVEIVWG
jgi:acyl carrier protein